MQYRTARQITTGLVVNKKINIKKEYYKKARSMCYELFKTGKFYIDKSIQGKNETENNKFGTLNQLEGILGFIYQIKRPYIENSSRYKPSGITKIYRDFLFYRYFYLAETPVILTEGKTDIIYLRTALKNLANQYKDFVEIKDDIIRFKIKFLNMSKNFLDVFAIPTGTSGLKKLMDEYEKIMKIFKGEGKNHPIIILIDNDEGSREIKNKLKNNKLQNNSFYHYTENLYVLLVPNNRTNGAIEDLFDEDTLNIKVDGKVFNRKEKIDNEKEYSKNIFAKKVIIENQNNINFDGFKEVFDNIRMIIDDYRKKVIQTT